MVCFMRRGEDQQQFIHLVRLAWDLKGLGMVTSIVLRPHEIPVLDVMRARGRPLRVQAIHRPHGWVFTWRPAWSRFWRQGEWTWALDEDAARKIRDAVTV
ncbi:hypothetical protein Misp02_10810 [Microtetraspora sp. NBRC 16547]|nr:hypothetical protein Misp02_10810 [Microtetraspora sp. NBRC 16547]